SHSIIISIQFYTQLKTTTMLKIKNPLDPIEVKNIKTLIYGQPGIRKTSYAFTAERPLMIDCDRGIRRVDPKYRKNYVEVNSWSDIAQIITDPQIKDFDTLIIDTAGKALDFLSAQIMTENPKLNFQ